MNHLLLLLGIICLFVDDGHGAVKRRDAKPPSNVLNGYFELLPHDPNGTFNRQLELSCHLDTAIAQLASKVVFAIGDSDWTFLKMINATVAMYSLAADSGVPMASIVLDETVLNFTCHRLAVAETGTEQRISCDLTSMASYLAGLVTFVYPSALDELPVSNVTHERIINATQVNFRVDSVPERSDMSAKVCCRLRRNVLGNLTIDVPKPANNCQIIHFGFEPFKPTILATNVTMVDCSSLTFSWFVGRRNKTYTTTYTPHYMALNEAQYQAYVDGQATGIVRSYVPYSPCSVIVRDMEIRTCTVAMDTYAVAYLIKVEGVNEVGSTSSDELLVNTIQYLTPSPVRELHLVTVSDTHAELRWSHHIVTCPMAVTFVVNVTCVDEADVCDHIPPVARFQKDERTFNQPVENKMVQHSVTSLHPYTSYRIDLATRLAGSDVSSGAKSLDVRTLPAVPSVPPQTCPNCFSLLSSNSSHIRLAVYWQRIPRHLQNNDIVSYRAEMIGYSGQPSVIAITPNNNIASVEFDLDSSSISDVTVTIAAVVQLGSEKKFSPDAVIEIPSAALSRDSVTAQSLSITLLEHNSTAVGVSWNEVTGAVGYTLAWRKRTGDISWRHVIVPSSALLPFSDLSDIAVGMAVDMGSYSTGLLWSECSFFAYKRPPSFQIKSDRTSSSSLTLSIEAEPCVVTLAVYEIVYCKGVRTDLCDGEDSSRKLRVEILERPNSEVTLTDLQADQVYTVLIRAHLPPGQTISGLQLPVVKHEQTLAADRRVEIVSYLLAGLVVVICVFVALSKRQYVKKICQRVIEPIKISNILEMQFSRHDGRDGQGRVQAYSAISGQQTGDDELHLLLTGGANRGHAARLSSSEQPLLDSEDQTEETVSSTTEFGIDAGGKLGNSRPLPPYSTTLLVNRETPNARIATYSAAVVIADNSCVSSVAGDGGNTGSSIGSAHSASSLSEERTGTSNVIDVMPLNLGRTLGCLPTRTVAFVDRQPSVNAAALLTSSVNGFCKTTNIGEENGEASSSCVGTAVERETNDASSMPSAVPLYSATALVDDTSFRPVSNGGIPISVYSGAPLSDENSGSFSAEADSDANEDWDDDVDENSHHVHSEEEEELPATSGSNGNRQQADPNNGYSCRMPEVVEEAFNDLCDNGDDAEDRDDAEDGELHYDTDSPYDSGSTSVDADASAMLHSNGCEEARNGGQFHPRSSRDDGYSSAPTSSELLIDCGSGGMHSGRANSADSVAMVTMPSSCCSVGDGGGLTDCSSTAIASTAGGDGYSYA